MAIPGLIFGKRYTVYCPLNVVDAAYCPLNVVDAAEKAVMDRNA